MHSAHRWLVQLLIICALSLGFSFSAHCEDNVIHLLNGHDLSNFYSFTKQSGANDTNHVFTLSNGILHVSGQEYGYLVTKQAYANYRLVAEFKWGEKTWGDRMTNARDSGVLINMQGKDVVWPKCIECQMIEGGTGDCLVVDGAYLTVNGVRKGPRIERFDRPGRNPWKDVKGFRGPHEIENPHGDWNTLEVINENGKVQITVNGHKTIEGVSASPSSGKVGVQTEMAEVFFRRLDLYPLHETERKD